MKKHPPTNIRTLRKILDMTQAELAKSLGVSEDAVVSWENGRNPLSKSYALRISRATGADDRSLMRKGPLWAADCRPQRAFTREDYRHHRKVYMRKPDRKSAERELGRCADALGLLFRAAARAGEGGGVSPLPAVVDSFVQWCRRTGRDFRLVRHIEAQLEERKHVVTLTKTRGQWREDAETGRGTARLFGFKNDPKMSDDEPVTLSAVMFPAWAPGWEMRRRKRG